MQTPEAAIRAEEYSEYMRGNGPAPEGVTPHRAFNPERKNYWGENPDYPSMNGVPQGPDALQGIASDQRARVFEIAAYLMKIAKGGLKPRVIRGKGHERFDVDIPEQDALRFAALDHKLETEGRLIGDVAAEHQRLRAKYHPLFFYRLRPEEADQPHMQE